MSEGSILQAHEYAERLHGLIERKRYTHAASTLAEALAQYPADSELLYASAVLDYMRGNKDEARSTLHAMLTRAPEHFGARSLLVHVYEDAGDLEQAEAVLIDLLKDYPASAHQFARYAMLMYRTLHIDKAKALAREALRLDPEDELALTACMMGDMIDGRSGAERQSLAELIGRHPESVATAHMLIRHLAARGRYRAARRIAIELLTLYPDSPDILALVVELDTLSHWSMLPLWPLNRWGWGASAGLYVLTVILVRVVAQLAPAWSTVFSFTLIGYCVYSWVYPPLLKRWLKRRAGI
jgi:tetratricopeptide (TPR) repeat protein